MNHYLQRAIAIGVISGMTIPTAALASNGYFAFGWGTPSKAMGGVAAALPQDTLVTATNPAGMGFIDTSLDIGVAFFSPSPRGYGAYDNYSRNEMGFPTTGFVTPGRYDSDSDWFLVPSIGYNHVLNDQMTIGISIFGNGGMNTNYKERPVWENFAGAPNQLAIAPGMTSPYPDTIAAPNGFLFSMGPDGRPVPVTDPNQAPGAMNVNPNGVFTATTPTGVNLEQLFVEIPFTYKINQQHSLGIAPVFAAQSFEAKGMEPFRQMSLYPDAVSNNGKDWSYGYGLHLGWVGEINDQLTLGASYRTKLWMTDFDDYKGLFADEGNFDIPAMLNLGVAFKVQPNITLAFDWQRIFYNEINSVGNSNNVNVMPCMMGMKTDNCLGGKNGLGFGWDDMDIFKLGARWDYDERFSFMAGAAYASDFAPDTEGLFNVMAPATIQWTFTLGATYRHSKSDSFNLSFAYMPEAALDDGSNANITGTQTGSLYMEQKDIEISWNHRF